MTACTLVWSYVAMPIDPTRRSPVLLVSLLHEFCQEAGVAGRLPAAHKTLCLPLKFAFQTQGLNMVDKRTQQHPAPDSP